MRRKMLDELKKKHLFYQKNEYIDKKIEYDLRFFNNDY